MRIGSSPRWRGTPFRPPAAAFQRITVHPRAGGERAGRLVAESFHLLRFIPALAGNAAGRPVAGLPDRGAVHPRAGGERILDERLPWERPDSRFIPALAGNAVLSAVDHLPSISSGSSPRWRGTHAELVGANTATPTPVHPRAGGERHPFVGAVEFKARSVHPRAGGERWEAGCFIAGSPVRFIPALAGNACLRGFRKGNAPFRFIPALAGNAVETRPLLPSKSSTVHPRAGGERIFRAGRSAYRQLPVHPRAGGERPSRKLTWSLFGRRRFIPALAGNASPSPLLPVCRPAVHPRAGGERIVMIGVAGVSFGSSPRWRGTLRSRGPGRRPVRFIPALAGNASTVENAATQPPVHPRAGGERPLCDP